MQGMQTTFSRGDLAAFARECCEGFRAADDGTAALEFLSGRAVARLGEYLNTSMIIDPDDIAIAFVELLDQIIFETGERKLHGGEHGEDYVLEDLHERAEIFLDVYEGAEVYRKNLAGRILRHDDTLIIRCLRLGEMVSSLVSEFFEQPHLRVAIMRALIYFPNDELLNFFYEIARNEYEPELKILALIGLRRNETVFYGWKRLAGSAMGWYDALVSHAAACDGTCRQVDDESDDPHLLFYKTICLEVSLAGSEDQSGLGRLFGVLNGIARQNLEIFPYRSTILDSISRILYRIRGETFLDFLRLEGTMRSFVHLMDCLPIEVFDRVLLVVESLGERFTSMLAAMVERGELRLDYHTSRLPAYLFPSGLNARVI